MRAKHSALILTAGFLLIPTMSWSQFPGMGGDRGGFPGGGGSSGRSRMMMDPDQLFDQYSKDGRTLRKEDLPQQMQMGLEMFGAQLGLTGNEWTREQLKESGERAKERIAQMTQGGGMSFRMAPGGGGGTELRMGDGRGMQMTPGGGFGGDRDRGIEEYFKKLDINEDGVLDFAELGVDRISESLQVEREKYDVNHDGWIDLGEFKGFMAARSGGQDGGRGRDNDPSKEDERKRPTLIRAGSLPRDFPYANLDADVDGQIGLYEWKSGGNRVADFLPMDLNNDGFLTYDEYTMFRRQREGDSGSQFARGSRGGPGAGMMAMGDRGNGMPGFGDRGSGMPGFGDRGRGQGGPGSGMPGFGDRGNGSGMPGFGDRGRGQGGPGSGMPGFGDRGSGMPGFGDRGNGSGMPGFGDRGTGMPGFGDRGRGQGGPGSGMPGFGDRGTGNPMTPGAGAFTPGRFGTPGATPGYTPSGSSNPQGGPTPPSGYGNRPGGNTGPGNNEGGGRRNGGGAPGGPKGKR